MIRADLRKSIEVMFEPLNSKAAALPAPMTLARALSDMIEKANVEHHSISHNEVGLFASAAVEVWQRGLHSFLISVATTGVSPVWSSVAGYYASHYAIRGIAHLLGHFHLHRKSKVIQLEMPKGGIQCSVQAKGTKDREHKYYWKIVAADPQFVGDPLFPRNDEGQAISDCSHRNRANYADHIDRFLPFRPLDEMQLRSRLERIASIEITIPPIPNADKFPDVESVQIVAYHRLVRFRALVDEILGGSNRFWTVHRAPSWAADYVDFQVAEADARDGLLN